MKKRNIIGAFVVLFAGLLIFSCGNSSITQISRDDSARTALEKTLKTIKDGNYKHAIEMMEGFDIANQSDIDFAEKMLQSKYEKNKGLVGWQIIWEDYSERDNMTLFKINYSYGTGGEEEDLVPMVWTEEGWRMRDMLYLVMGQDELGRKMIEMKYTLGY